MLASLKNLVSSLEVDDFMRSPKAGKLKVPKQSGTKDIHNGSFLRMYNGHLKQIKDNLKAHYKSAT